MYLTDFHKRIIHRNPLYPYTWEAEYSDGTKLKQYGTDAYHYSHEIDRHKITRLVMKGNGVEIGIPRVYTDRVPDEIILMAQVDMQVMLGMGTIDGVDKTASVFAGFRYGREKYVLKFDPSGHVYKIVECPKDRVAGAIAEIATPRRQGGQPRGSTRGQ
jgi:hypothetical protein